MITFKQYIVEGQADLENLEHQLDNFVKAGEIVNPEYVRLKGLINRGIENASRGMHTLVKSSDQNGGRTDDMYAIEDSLGSLWYDVPNSTNEVLALKNKLARVKTAAGRQHPYFRGLDDFYKKYSPLAEKVKKLKDIVVTTAKKREDVKVQKDVVMKKKFKDSASLIEVLKQHLDEYVQRAGKMAGEQVDHALDVLKKADWDLDKAAPYPKTGIGRAAYLSALEKRNYLEHLSTRVDQKSEIRKPSAEARKHKIEQAEKGAHGSYMAWVAKMIDKIGKTVDKATMSGSPWTGSTLRVTTHDGEEQVWDNKMIINQSKYGTLFNQFPSRRVK